MSHPDPLYEVDVLEEIQKIRVNLQNFKEELLKKVADLQFLLREQEENRKQIEECVASVQELLTKI